MPRYILVLAAALAMSFAFVEMGGALITAGQVASSGELARVDRQVEN